MSEPIGKNTARGKDLTERADVIAGKEKIHAQYKAQAKAIKNEITDHYKSAQNAGYAVRTLKKAVKEVLLTEEEREDLYKGEQAAQLELDLYRHALGLLDGDDADEGEPETLNDEIYEEVFGENDTVQFGNGPQIPARDFAKAAKRVGRGVRKEIRQ